MSAEIIKWEAKLITHRGFNRIAIYFENNSEFNNRIKKIKGVKWSASLKAWHIPDTNKNRVKLNLNIEKENSLIHQVNQEAIPNLRQR